MGLTALRCPGNSQPPVYATAGEEAGESTAEDVLGRIRHVLYESIDPAPFRVTGRGPSRASQQPGSPRPASTRGGLL